MIALIIYASIAAFLWRAGLPGGAAFFGGLAAVTAVLLAGKWITGAALRGRDAVRRHEIRAAASAPGPVPRAAMMERAATDFSRRKAPERKPARPLWVSPRLSDEEFAELDEAAQTRLVTQEFDRNIAREIAKLAKLRQREDKYIALNKKGSKSWVSLQYDIGYQLKLIEKLRHEQDIYLEG